VATGSVQYSAAVVSFSPLHRDARVQRQIRALTAICRVTAFGFTDPGIEGVDFVDVSPGPKTMLRKALKVFKVFWLKGRRFEAVYHSGDVVRKAAEMLKGRDFALIVANDVSTLPLALEFRGQAKVLFDAHEYAPRHFESWFFWRFFMQDYMEYLCRSRISQVDAMTTVGPVIADEYAREFGVRPSVVLNAPYYCETSCKPHDGDIIRMVHHGSASRLRQLEVMIDAMAHLDDRFRLDLMLVPGDAAYIASLEKRVSSDPRIAFVPPVTTDEIVEQLSHYDVGLCTYALYSFNALYSLPNKFFDFIQARLCIVAVPLPEVVRLMEQNHCGVVARDFSAVSLAEALQVLDRQRVETFRQAANTAAATLCYERSAEVLLNTARRLLGLSGGLPAESVNGAGRSPCSALRVPARFAWANLYDVEFE